jgi:hypothetical protein
MVGIYWNGDLLNGWNIPSLAALGPFRKAELGDEEMSGPA